jgi:hypothetical protein
MKQGLRGNTADVEADAAKSLSRLDQTHRKAKVGGAEGRRVAAGASAYDNHIVSFFITHDSYP